MFEAISGLAQGLGSFFGGTQAANSSAEAMRWNTNQQLKWERERATNAHQWEVEDLEKAGLNKVLTAGGSGATTGSLTPTMPDTSGIKSAYEGLGNIINSAQSALKTTQEIKMIDAQKNNLNADSELKTVQAAVEAQRKGLISAQTCREIVEANLSQKNLDLLDRWGNWKMGSEVFKNVSMPIISAIGAFGSLTKLGKLGKYLDKISNQKSGNTINNNYYQNFASMLE